MKRNRIVLDYISKYKATYMIIASLFLIGVLMGVIYINIANQEKIENLSLYVYELINNVKNNIYKTPMNSIINSIFKNSREIIIIWFLGCTVIGGIFIYIAVIYKGFSIGYTISALIAVLGIKQGALISITSLLLQNIIFLPAFFIIAENRNKII